MLHVLLVFILSCVVLVEFLTEAIAMNVRYCQLKLVVRVAPKNDPKMYHEIRFENFKQFND